jgi:hypothetical protein
MEEEYSYMGSQANPTMAGLVVGTKEVEKERWRHAKGIRVPLLVQH